MTVQDMTAEENLTADDVGLICLLLEEREQAREVMNNLTYAKIGEKFGVDARTIQRINRSGYGRGA